MKIKILTIASSSSPITPTKWLVSFATFLTQSFYPNPFFWEIFFQLRKDAIKLTLATVVIVIIGGWLFTRTRKVKGIGFPTIIIFLNSLMISFTSWAQMRYFYFLAFPSALFWVYLLKKIKNQWLMVVVILFLIIPQYFFIFQRYQEWAKASAMSKKIVSSLTDEKGCEQIKKNKYQAWIGDDRYKAYIIVHPEKVMELFFNKSCP
jgi:hypothetical protein